MDTWWTLGGAGKGEEKKGRRRTGDGYDMTTDVSDKQPSGHPDTAQSSLQRMRHTDEIIVLISG